MNYSNCKAGDVIRIRLAKEELECTLLESHDSSVLLVKLSSGYNIGIPKENVLGIEIVKAYELKREKFQPVHDVKKKTIGLILTGGTIASKLDPKTGGVSSLASVEEFSRFYPGLFDTANIILDSPFMTLSANMDSERWIEIANTVKRMLDDPKIDGIIVTHGTDTLHYTAAALSFFLPKPSKPIVLTYAQRSIDRASSDADLNLRCAARFALSDCAEVTLVGHADLNDDFCYALRGTKVRKLHTSRRDAFRPVNCEPIAKVWPDKVEFLGSFRTRHKDESEIDAVFNDKIALVKFYPGQTPDIIDFYFSNGFKGLIIEAYGLGNLPSADFKNSWIPKIKEFIKKGGFVGITAQTIFGRLNSRVYSTGRGLLAAGVVPLEDMLSETAFVKLGWLLGHKNWRARGKISEKMIENIADEFNQIITE